MADRQRSTAQQGAEQRSSRTGGAGREGGGRGEERSEATTANRGTQPQKHTRHETRGTSRGTGHKPDGPTGRTTDEDTTTKNKKEQGNNKERRTSDTNAKQTTKGERERRESWGADGAREKPRPLVTRKCNKKRPRREKVPARCVYERPSHAPRADASKREWDAAK